MQKVQKKQHSYEVRNIESTYVQIYGCIWNGVNRVMHAYVSFKQ